MDYFKNFQLRKIQCKADGFTLMELMVVILIVSASAGLAIVGYQKTVEQTKEREAATQLRSIYAGMESYYIDNNKYPDDSLLDDYAGINDTLNLNVTSDIDGLAYDCTVAVDFQSYTCDAYRPDFTSPDWVLETAGNDICFGKPYCASASSCPSIAQNPGCEEEP